VPDDGDLPGLRKLCDEAGILLILDEIQKGDWGARGKLWAYETFGVRRPTSDVPRPWPTGCLSAPRSPPMTWPESSPPGRRLDLPSEGNPGHGGRLTVFATLIEGKVAESAGAWESCYCRGSRGDQGQASKVGRRPSGPQGSRGLEWCRGG